MPTTALSTAAAAEIFAALTLLPPPTVSSIPSLLEHQARLVQRITTRSALIEGDGHLYSAKTTNTTSMAGIRNVSNYSETHRPTTLREKLVGELRRWGLLTANWDGEGATVPAVTSLKEAVSFIRLLSEEGALPEPMLHGSGHAGLFWKDDSLYADIEFLGDGRVAYYIERQGDKHKGVVKFDSQRMPALFPALLGD